MHFPSIVALVVAFPLLALSPRPNTGAASIPPRTPLPVHGATPASPFRALVRAHPDSAQAELDALLAPPKFAALVHHSAAPRLRDLVVPMFDAVVSVGDANKSSDWDRDQCVTFSAGPAAAVECGDLRLVHGLPAVTTLGKSRSLTMLYNSRTAHPIPILAAIVRPPTWMPTPTTVEATLYVGAAGQPRTQRAYQQWTAADFTAGSARRIAMSYDASSEASGRYTFSIVVSLLGPGTVYTYTSEDGEFVLVNRSGSPYGKGWWPAGMEQLISEPGGDKTWIGGDASTRHYRQSTSQLWRANAVDRPDSLTCDAAGACTRWAEHRTQVRFDAYGRHAATTNRLGHTTQFNYAYGNTLNSVTVPMLASPLYGFSYGSAVTISSPGEGAVRTTSMNLAADGTVASICDPDAQCVQFGYKPGVLGVMSSRTNALGVQTAYATDAVSLATSVSQDVALVPITTSFQLAEGHGVSRGETVTLSHNASDLWSAIYGPISGYNYAEYLDPRFYLTRQYSMGVVLLDVLHNNASFPALATDVIGPNGFTTHADYDVRGNLVTSTAINPLGDGRNAVGTVEWSSDFDQVTRTTTPTGVVSTSGYDPANGNLLWRQVGADPVRRSTFGYDANALVISALAPAQVNPSRLTRDALGNVTQTVSALGSTVSTTRDAIGRPTRVVSPLDVAGVRHVYADVSYDMMDRDTLSVTWSDSVYAHNRLTVRTHYTALGQPDTVATLSGPGFGHGLGWDTHVMTYDRFNRIAADQLSGMRATNYQYDAAGNRLNGGGRGGSAQRIDFDNFNRPITRTVLNSVIVPDTARFGYDPITSELLSADNRYASVHRTYYPNGALRTDTLRIAMNIASATPILAGTWHRSGITYTYDLDGRRIGMNADGRTQGYGYDPVTGDLATITDPDGHRYDFQYDAAQRLKRRIRQAESTNNLVEDMVYDDDSRLTTLTVNRVGSAPATVRADAVTYDGRGKVTVAGLEDFTYSPLGAVILGHTGRTERLTEHFDVDALGRVLYRSLIGLTGSTRTDMTYNAIGANLNIAVTANQPRPDSAQSYYDAWGARTSVLAKHYVGAVQALSVQPVPIGEARGNHGKRRGQAPDRVNAPLSVGALLIAAQPVYARTRITEGYDGAGLLSQSFVIRDTVPTLSGTNSSYETREKHRYDALGRRVWSGMLRGMTQIGSCARFDFDSGCQNTATWTRWDGNQILLESQGTIAAMDPDFIGDYESATVAYVHAGGIDSPLAISESGAMSYTFHSARNALDLTDCLGAPCPETSGERTTAYGALAPSDLVGPTIWHGSLLDAGRTGSGLLYRRNRYLDASTGSFTQTDPAGLGGGLNLYGFGGDPVNFSDPFGLCPVVGFFLGPAVAAGTGAWCVAELATLGVAAWMGARSLSQSLQKEEAGEGSTGGPTAGRRATKGDRQAARDRNRAANEDGELRCVHCGVETTEEPGKPNSSQIDHQQPRNPRDGGAQGNNDPTNLKNSCRTCNLDKSNKRPPYSRQ